MNLLPAILLGGPPHSGKSVLAHSLSQRLRERNLPHYLLRAAPDGEGDWTQWISPDTLSDIRFKGTWTLPWVRVVCRDIAARTVPLLVDMGGKPQDEQFAIFNQCTGVILVTPLGDEAAHAQWQTWAVACGLPILADLRSALVGTAQVLALEPILQGTLIGLRRGEEAKGSVVDATVEMLARLFQFSKDEVRWRNLASAPEDAVLVDMDALARALDAGERPGYFGDSPEAVDDILARIPADVPLAVYGRMPCWLAALLGARRHLRYQFDVRLGWVRPPHFEISAQADDNRWLDFKWETTPAGLRLCVTLREYYLDYALMQQLAVPALPGDALPGDAAAVQPVRFFGKLPLWAFAALGRAYRAVPEIWAEQPREDRQKPAAATMPAGPPPQNEP